MKSHAVAVRVLPEDKDPTAKVKRDLAVFFVRAHFHSSFLKAFVKPFLRFRRVRGVEEFERTTSKFYAGTIVFLPFLFSFV